MKVWALLAGILWLYGCQASIQQDQRLHSQEDAPALFDVNDVSILWPPPQGSGERDLLPHLASAAFITEQNFQTLLSLARPEDDQGFSFLTRADWRVVGVRYDPCAKDDPLASDCRRELRLVAQPLPAIGMPVFADHAMHLIYRLSPSQGEGVEEGLWRLKTSDTSVTTNDKPLSVHPILQEQGLGGPFATGLRDLLRTFAQEKDLHEATVMLNIGITQWRFARSLKSADGALSHAAIPFVDSDIEILTSEGRDSGDGMRNEVSPHASGPDNVNASVDSDGATSAFYALSATDQAKAIQTALRIDNPLRHTPATVDCVSCHMASRILARVKGLDFLDAVDGNPDRFPPPPGITTTNRTYADELTNGAETRAFGYGKSGTFPSVTQRTIHDSARVAGFLNARVRNR